MTDHAVCIVSKEQADLVEVASPPPLGVDEIRGRTLCTLVSPGTELATFYGSRSFPAYPGYAAVFVVEDVGVNVRGWSKGDAGFCMGPHRSFQQVDSRAAYLLPKTMPPQIAVLARLMIVSMTTLKTTDARPGDNVIVSGAGPVGYLAAQMFLLSGYQVFVVEPDDARRGYVERAGIARTFNRMPVGDAAIAGTIALVVECSGHEQAVLDACRIVRKRGEVVLVGVPWQRRTDIHAHELLSLVFRNYVVLRSGWEWELPHHSADFQPHSVYGAVGTALRWLTEGRIRTDGLILRAEPRHAQDTYQDLLHRRSSGLFTVFDWTGRPTEDRERLQLLSQEFERPHP